MKKRLLSAALALAMVLTLLPVSVFAAYSMEQKTPQQATYTLNGVTHSYFEANANGTSYTTVTVARATATNYTDGREYGKWYFLANKGSDSGTNQKYYEVTSGIVTGVSGSGQWYPDVATYSKTVNGNTSVNGAFTVLDSATSLDLSSYTNSSLQVDISANGATLTVPANITSLTITSKWLAEQGQKGSLAAININRSAFDSGVKTGLNLTAENISIGGISLEGRSNTVTLKNCTVSGAITMSGTTVTSQQGNTTYTAQKLTTTGTVLSGAVTLSGDGSTASLTDTTGGAAVSVTGNGGSVTVAGKSNLGAITTVPRTTTGQWPSVSVTGGTVKSITQTAMAGNSNTMKIDVGSTNPTGIPMVDGTITAEKGTVTITSADAAAVIVKAGDLNINGSGVDVKGTVYLGATNTTNLSINATGSTFGGITAQNGANLVIKQWVGKRWSDGGNNYGILNLGTYSGKKVTGGTFSTSTDFSDVKCLNWLDAYTTTGTSANLQFYVKRNGNYDLYSKTELARAISDISTANAKIKGNIVVLGQAATYNITLMNGNVEWANIGFDTTTGIVLPTQINNVTINEWIGPNNAIVAAGKEEPIAGTGNITLNATGITSSVKRFTKVTNSLSDSGINGGVNNQNVNVTLNGNNIALSGAVNPGAGGWATVLIDLETDVVGTDGQAVVLEDVVIEYNPTTRAVVFSTWQPAKLASYGVIVQTGELVLNQGTGARYTVSANLSVSASDLGLYVGGNEIQATVGGNLRNWTQAQKDVVINYFTSGTFAIGNNQAVQVAINAAQATITNNSSVATWVTNAKNTIWRNGLKDANGQYITVGGRTLVPHTGNFDPSTADGAAIASYFGKAYLVPYLVVDVTAFDQNGTLTATLTPYYRVDVSGDSSVGGYQKGQAYTAQTGRALTLASNSVDMDDPVVVTLNLPAGFNNKFMHQDGKYVYQASGQTWKISHSGTGSTLGTIVINDQVGPITLNTTIQGRKPTLDSSLSYDSLQAAIDDTVPGVTAVNNQVYGNISSDTVVNATDETMDYITIAGTYTGSCDITMTGLARKVLVIANGQQNVKSTSSTVSVQNTGGFKYIVQLNQDVGVTGNVVITVNNSSTNLGTISASTSRASAGQVVTVTAVPATGYGLTGIRAVTDTGATVNVTSTGTANQYSFTVPTGATSITITPTFGVAGRAQINVASVANGSATTSATGGTAQGGSVVTVYTLPSSGYRATSVTVSTNVGTVSATNTGTNTWTFTVPTNATTVTVTPNFSVDTGVPFLDVPYNDYYLNAVKFVYSHGMMQGDGSTTVFNGNGNITRGQIVTILYRLENSPVVPLSTSFKDVPTNQYYAAPVAWASANGIVNGRNSTTFDPNANITRQELAAILYRYNTQYKKLSTGTTNNLSAFTDRDRVDSDFAIIPMQWAVGNGIITGTTPTTLSPSGTATRYQAATMLMRYCQTFLKMS